MNKRLTGLFPYAIPIVFLLLAPFTRPIPTDAAIELFGYRIESSNEQSQPSPSSVTREYGDSAIAQDEANRIRYYVGSSKESIRARFGTPSESNGETDRYQIEGRGYSTFAYYQDGHLAGTYGGY
jgi:hypothetical protein